MNDIQSRIDNANVPSQGQYSDIGVSAAAEDGCIHARLVIDFLKRPQIAIAYKAQTDINEESNPIIETREEFKSGTLTELAELQSRLSEKQKHEMMICIGKIFTRLGE